MTNTNGHGPRTCVLYARVSNRSQADTFSLPVQFRELRAWAETNGYAVVEEVADTGGKDSKRDVFDRPGINRIFDICEEHPVGVVVAQERSRFGEYPVPDMISYRLAQYGAALCTPGDSGEGEAGELMRMFTDWDSRRERRTTARRSRSRKLEQARNGYVVSSHTPTYGFRVAGDRTKRVYEIEEDHMATVRRIFEMVGVEGLPNRAVAKRLTGDGTPTPPAPVKKKHPEKAYGWRPQFVRKVVLNDAYRAHAPEEIGALVDQGFMAPEVAVRLDPEKSYGVWWYEGGDFEGVKHRVAVPVPDLGVPREVADAARAAVENNVPLSRAGDERFWELSGGMLRCGGCGLRMQAHAVTTRGREYHYVRCPMNQRTTPERCPVNARLSAAQVEEAVWGFVSETLNDPARVVEGIDRLIRQEKAKLRTDPEAEQRELRGRLEALVRRRAAFQEQQAEGMMTLDELRPRLLQVEEAREDVLRQIEASERRGERVRALEALRSGYSGDLMREAFADQPDAPVDEIQERFMRAVREKRQERVLDAYTPEQRRERYEALELRVVAHSKEELEISGVFGRETLYICEPSPRLRGTTTPSSASTRTASSSRAAGSPRTWRASACGTSPP